MCLTSSMALTQIREPPDVAQSHAEAHAGEQILGFVVPFGPVTRLLLLHPLQLIIRRDAVFQTWVWKLHFELNHSGGLSKLVSAAAEMFALRCFRECAKKHAKKLSCSLLSLWVLPHLYNLGKGAGILTLTYGTAVISSSLQSVLYFVMSAILGRCDHLKTATGYTLHTVSVFTPLLSLNSVVHNTVTKIYSEKQ